MTSAQLDYVNSTIRLAAARRRPLRGFLRSLLEGATTWRTRTTTTSTA